MQFVEDYIVLTAVLSLWQRVNVYVTNSTQETFVIQVKKLCLLLNTLTFNTTMLTISSHTLSIIYYNDNTLDAVFD